MNKENIEKDSIVIRIKSLLECIEADGMELIEIKECLRDIIGV